MNHQLAQSHGNDASPMALEGLTVLDIAGSKGGYCGKLFADLGAQVILVEPTFGATTRYAEPRIQSRDDVNGSLLFQYQNTNKRSIALDLDTKEGQSVLRELAQHAHLLIESEAPGVMAARNLDYDSLRAIAPQLVVMSLSDFGQTGPYANWQASDLVAMAMGGMLYLAGYKDSAPIVAFGEQAVGAVNLFGAVAAMAALFDAEISGVGQYIDVSMQESVVMGLENAVQFYDLEGTIRCRNAGEQRLAGTGVFPCKNGYIYLMAGGVGGNRFWPATTQWLVDEGLPQASSLRDRCWSDDAFLASKGAKDTFADIFGPFALAHTKSELEARGRQRRIPIAPIYDTSELDTDQRQLRNYFVNATTEDGIALRMPGAPYILSQTPWSLRTAAPTLGQHTEDVLALIKLSKNKPETFGKNEAKEALLAGVRVVDFTWIGAGSYTTKLLADLGADVIKIETSKRLDSLRLAKPYKDKIPGVNRSGYFADRNSSKRSITVNIKEAEGLALVKRLIEDAHVVVNNFTPGVMDKLGLGYDVVRSIQPQIIYAAMSMQGSHGPDSSDLGYGLTIGAVTGLQHLTGLPEREPAGTGTNYPDHIPNPTHAAFAILAALRHQRKTGTGQSIDIAQTEPTIAMLGPAVMNFFVNGIVQNRDGNRHSQWAPQGVYRCKGEDRWIAITIQSDLQWRSLCRVLSLNAVADWSDLAPRLEHQGKIDQILSDVCADWENVNLATVLQEAGVPAGPVLDARDVLEHDPQLRVRNHWVNMDHPEMGPSTYNSAPFRFSVALAAPSSPAPLLGQHTYEIAQELLELSESEIKVLIENDILV